MLTCEVTGSILTWKNSEYISGDGDSLRLSLLNNTDTPLYSSVYNTTFAVLTKKLLQHEVYQMVSEVHITIRADVASTPIACVDDREIIDSFSLRSLSGIFINI